MRPRGGAWRPVALLFGGVLAPMAAFGLDGLLRVNPVLWGGFGFRQPLGLGLGLEGVGPRSLAVYALLGLALLGMSLHLVSGSRRPAMAFVTAPLLLSGVLLALVHAVAFMPLLPLSAVAIMACGIGLLGFTPYIALLAYAAAWLQAMEGLAGGVRGRRRALAALALAFVLGLAPMGSVALPYLHMRRVLVGMRAGAPADISRGFRALGALARLARPDLISLYDELQAPAQLRLRNLYLERFERDIHDDVGRRIRMR